MATIEQSTATGVSFALTDEQKALRRARARLRGQGDPAEGTRLRRPDASPRRRDREGARGRAHEPPRPGGARRPRSLVLRRDARRRGALLGLLRHRHVDLGERPRRRPGRSSSAREEQKAHLAHAADRVGRSSARSGSRSPAPARTSPRSRRRPSARATSTSSTARRPSSRTPATPTGRSSSRRPTRAPAQRDVARSSSRWTRPASRSSRTSTRWASARPTRRRSPSRTCAFPSRTGSARRATASRSRWRRSTDASRHRDRRGRRRAGRLRALRRVREGARHVRHADRDAPGRQLHDRRHGNGDRGVAPALLAGGLDARPGLRPQGDALLLVRQALRRRHGDEGRDRRRAGLRRLRLHQGVPGREAHARREAVPDLRGHVADPAPRDRARDLHAEVRARPARRLEASRRGDRAGGDLRAAASPLRVTGRAPRAGTRDARRSRACGPTIVVADLLVVSGSRRTTAATDGMNASRRAASTGASSPTRTETGREDRGDGPACAARWCDVTNRDGSTPRSRRTVRESRRRSPFSSTTPATLDHAVAVRTGSHRSRLGSVNLNG